MVGKHVRLASLSKPLEPVKIIKAVADTEASEAKNNSSDHIDGLNDIHLNFLNFGQNTRIQNKVWSRKESRSQNNDLSRNSEHELQFQTFDNLPKELNPKANMNASSVITCYEDLRIIDKYSEKEILYGTIRSLGRLLRTRIEIITFCMKKYVVFKAYK